MGMSWLGCGSDRSAILGTLPAIAADFDALYESLWNQSHIPPPVLEICRLRLAQLHRAPTEIQHCESELSTHRRDNLTRWATDGSFSSAERVCLAFTEVYAMDANELTDEQAEAVKVHYGDSGLVLLVEALGILDGMTRLSLLWELGPDASQQLDLGDLQ
jgi:alkylhydroperoxidase family enzyme